MGEAVEAFSLFNFGGSIIEVATNRLFLYDKTPHRVIRLLEARI